MGILKLIDSISDEIEKHVQKTIDKPERRFVVRKTKVRGRVVLERVSQIKILGRWENEN